MDRCSINENPSAWENPNYGELKILSLNCMGLKPHYNDINNMWSESAILFMESQNGF